jgi:aspartate dehydrogenase
VKKIGIVGCGTIGSLLAKKIDKDFRNSARISGLCDIDRHKAETLISKLSKKVPILSLNNLIKSSDLIIEAASGKYSADICKKSVQNAKDVMIMSTGGLLGHDELFDLAKKKACSIIIPSGAICGLDGLKSAGAARISSVILTTRKPPKGLEGAPYIIKNNIDLKKIKAKKTIFDGTASQAVRGFPKNVNVSAILSIAGIGSRKTRVRIVTSPRFKANMHEVEIKGDFGRLITRTENIPSPKNPKTSYLAALSAAATLKQLLEAHLKIGT